MHREQQQKKKESTKIQEDLPEFLPEDIFDDIEEEEEEQEQEIAAAKGKHLKLQDFEEFDKRALAKQIKEEKLKQLKLRKKLIVKRGPVHVKVTSISSQQVNKKLVPVAENKIVNSRNKWLKRKSLGKK